MNAESDRERNASMHDDMPLAESIAIDIIHTTGGLLVSGRLERPFGFIGSDPDCEIVLSGADIPDRVAFYQVVDGSMIVVSLPSLEAIRVDADRDWCTGEFSLRSPAHRGAGTEPLPLESPATAAIEFIALNGRSASARWAMPHRFSLIGSSAKCPLRLDAIEVADAHAYIVELDGSAWLVDLGSPAGSYVNGKRIRCMRLRDGDELRFGQFRLACRIDPWGEWPARSEAVLVPLTVAELPASNLPSSTDGMSGAQFLQMLADSQQQMMKQIAGSMQEMMANFMRSQQEQLSTFQNELARLAEVNLELHKLYAQRSEAEPLVPLARALYSPLPEIDDPAPISESTAASHLYIAERMSNLMAERDGLWNRMKGAFGLRNMR